MLGLRHFSCFEHTGHRFGFNGMEKDDEVKGNGNSLDFGSRILDPRLGRWLSRDPLAPKFPDQSPYNFVANSPLLFIDPDGRDIVLSFAAGPNGESSSKAYLEVVNMGLEGQFTAKLTRIGESDSYKLSFVPSAHGGDIKKMTANGEAFYRHMSAVINDHENTVKHKIVYSDATVHVGQYTTGKIDIADVKQFNITGPSIEKSVGASQIGKLVHETVEQYQKVQLGLGDSRNLEGFDFAHDVAIQAEDEVNQNKRDPKQYKGSQGGLGSILFKYKEKDGSTTRVEYNFKPNEWFSDYNGTNRVSQPKPRGKMREENP